MRRRLAGTAAVLALALLAGACTSTSAGSGPSGPSGPGTVSQSVEPPPAAPGALAKAACAMPHDQLLRVWRGTYPERSGQILLVPQEPNFLGSNFPHSGPWDYLQDVPLLWYGPGVIPALGEVDRPVTIADIAPTQAKLLGYDFPPVDGKALAEIAAPTTPPKLIVTLVWDAGGTSVLNAFPNDWPNLKALIPKGVYYGKAEVGSSPSITPATHATIGTGEYPMHTGQTDAEFFLGGDLVRAGQLGPVLMMEPTLGDLYDRAMGNAPLVGNLSSVTWHLNMSSHGALWGGGDKDIAVLRTPTAADNEGAEGTTWNLQGKNQPFFTFPAYVNDLPPLSSYTDAIDREDGALDGKWRDNSIAQYENGWATPARIPYQERMVEEVITREGFGADDVPDLLFTNSKAIDHISHIWSVNSPEMQDTLRWQDAALGDFVDFLDRQVGSGNYVLVLTADHGAQFDPKVSGAFQVTPGQLQQDLEAAFPSATSDPVFVAVRTSQIYLNEDAMRASGYTVDQISQFLLEYTKGQGAPGGPSTVPEAERDDRFFSAVIPTAMLPDLKCLPEARA
ncbi:MAG: alkaline phosphatase family protein [Solirubrobacterales bacterium]